METDLRFCYETVNGGQMFAEQRPIVEVADAFELYVVQTFTKSIPWRDLGHLKNQVEYRDSGEGYYEERACSERSLP
jgi:hypothetical protein